MVLPLTLCIDAPDNRLEGERTEDQDYASSAVSCKSPGVWARRVPGLRLQLGRWNPYTEDHRLILGRRHRCVP
ncbi:hypothetical protein, partial [Arthrobacter sp. TB 23]|uniref:hypothetical protein n=1 Tax=Arthrobacter sp. TB 23 TaxID=494419 RepID=UPI001ED92580